MVSTSTIIHILSLILPFANETAIVLTHSKIPFFNELYRPCIEGSIIHSANIKRMIQDKTCNTQDYIHRILIDLVAYLGIMLFICKNTLLYGYITGIFTGLVMIFCSMILTTLFLCSAITHITHILKIKNPHSE